MESEGSKEKGSKGAGSYSGTITLQKAVDLGEYDPAYLSRFEEWNLLSRHAQFMLVKQGIKNRRSQLLQEWAQLNNTLNARLKPHIQEAMDRVWEKIKALEYDAERLHVEYSR
jgi:hypothetical protein